MVCNSSIIIRFQLTNVIGFIAVYDVATALREGKTGLRDRMFTSLFIEFTVMLTRWLVGILPTHYFPVHQSAIQTITWIRAPTISATGVKTSDNPTIIASGGFDGQEIFSDIRECDPIVLNRTRGSPIFCLNCIPAMLTRDRSQML